MVFALVNKTGLKEWGVLSLHISENFCASSAENVTFQVAGSCCAIYSLFQVKFPIDLET